MGALIVVDLERIKSEPQVIGAALMKVRYRKMGSLVIYLVTRGADLREWAESVRETLAKNFDVTVSLYPVESLEVALSRVSSICHDNDATMIDKRIAREDLIKGLSHCRELERI